jgi:hypothetical protein
MIRRLLILSGAFALTSAVMAAPVPKGSKFTVIPIQEKANQALDEPMGSGYEGCDLKNLPTGEQKLNEVTFEIGKKILQVRSKFTPRYPEKIEGVAVNLKCDKIHMLQACIFGGTDPASAKYCKDGTEIGEYVVHYSDKSTAKITIVYGKHLRDWCYSADEAKDEKKEEKKDEKADELKIAWKGENDFFTRYNNKVRLYQSSWDNPHPGKEIATIDFVSFIDQSPCGPFCVSLTAESR